MVHCFKWILNTNIVRVLNLNYKIICLDSILKSSSETPGGCWCCSYRSVMGRGRDPGCVGVGMGWWVLSIGPIGELLGFWMFEGIIYDLLDYTFRVSPFFSGINRGCQSNEQAKQTNKHHFHLSGGHSKLMLWSAATNKHQNKQTRDREYKVGLTISYNK